MNTDNWQEIGLAGWLAGIIDGEGTVSLTISRRRQNMIRTTPKVLIGNTDEGIIQRTIEALAKVGVGHYQRHCRPIPGHVMGRPVPAFKPVTMIEVSGFDRVATLLKAVQPFLAGAKAERAQLLIKFISERLSALGGSTKARNQAYRAQDVENALAFLRVTKTKNIDHIAKLLNEHTRETRQDHRRAMKRQHYRAAAERGYTRPSRRALTSRESVRADGNVQPPL
ncbi:MAG TPA: hypothetical protein VJQ82_08750 [Terriglobales bacterium]|nr:hypothetical protein [Terriglobales bacterium]